LDDKIAYQVNSGDGKGRAGALTPQVFWPAPDFHRSTGRAPLVRRIMFLKD